MLSRTSLRYACLGLVAGMLYAAFDYSLDAMLGEGTLQGSLAVLHLVVLTTLPCVTGVTLALMWNSRRERARAAEELRLRLERIEREQAVWMMAAAVLHEVNNPLHAIGLLVDEALLDGPSPLLERVREHVDRVGTHLGRLRQLPRTGAPASEALRLDDIVRRVLADRAPRVEELGVGVRTKLAADRAHGDGDYVRLIVENLVDNALRALCTSTEPRTLELRVQRDTSSVLLEVEDSGAGVGADPQAPFEPFRTTFAGGLGLGLPIARALARAMHGEVELSCARPTTFTLRLPAEVPR